MSKNKEKKKKLSEEEELYAVEKILEEIRAAKEYLQANNMQWQEQLLNPQRSSLKKIPPSELDEMERRYHRQYLLSNSEERKEIPLRTATLIDRNGNEYTIEFGRVDWQRIDDHQEQKGITFNNEGTIICSQITRGMKGTTYDARFNVLTPNFQVVMMIDNLNDVKDKTFSYDYYSLEFDGSILKEVWNDTEIYRDLDKKTTKAYKVKNKDTKAKKKITDVDTIEAIEEIIIDKVYGILSDIPVKGLIERIDQCLGALKKQKGIQKNKKSEKPNKEGEK